MAWAGLPPRPADSKDAKWIFNPPPGWPEPPAGWQPPMGWRPDPSWPPAPAGWSFWKLAQDSGRKRVSTFVKAVAGTITLIATITGTYLTYLAVRGNPPMSVITAALQAAMTRAVEAGALDAQTVIIDARRQAGRQVAPVIPIGALARYDRPAPALDAYDQLLTRTIP